MWVRVDGGGVLGVLVKRVGRMELETIVRFRRSVMDCRSWTGLTGNGWRWFWFHDLHRDYVLFHFMVLGRMGREGVLLLPQA